MGLLFTMHDAASARLRFHGVRTAMIEAQADALGLDLHLEPTTPDDYERVFLRTLGSLRDQGIGGVIFGNIHLADVRGWYEERVRAAGLAHVEPLWGGDPAALVAEFLDRGYRTRVVSVDLERGDPAWIGRELTADLAAAIAAREGTDAAGERGEYHTFAFEGPLFARPVAHRTGDEVEREGHRLVDVIPPG